MWNPETIALLQHAVRAANGDVGAALQGDARGAARRCARARPTSSTASTRARSTRTPRARRRCAACCSSARSRGDGRRADPARGGRAGDGDRQALLHRRDEPRLDLARGARDARDRDEPARRALEHGRGRRGPGALHARRERRPPPLGDQAGRLGPLRRDDPLPRQRRRAADQDGPGRQARRGRPAAGAQGRRLHRLDPPHDARRRADLAAAPPRHLLDRGPQAADLRPALRQPRRRRSRSSSSPRSASARSPPASRRRTPTTC